MATGDSFKTSDGKSVNVDLSYVVSAHALAYAEGWLGIASGYGESGDTIALQLEGEYQVEVPSSLTLSKGDVLRIDTTHVTGHTPDDDTSAYNKSAASSTNLTLGKVTVAKDANNVATIRLMIGGA